MSYFFENGRFPEDRYEYPRKSKNLVVVLCWNTILCLPLVWYFISVILSGSVTSLLTAAAIALVGTLHNHCWINHNQCLFLTSLHNQCWMKGMEITFERQAFLMRTNLFFPMKGLFSNRSKQKQTNIEWLRNNQIQNRERSLLTQQMQNSVRETLPW